MKSGFRVTLCGVFLAWAASAGGAESIHLTSLHPRAESEIKSARRLVSEGSLGAAIGRMQRLLDDSAGRNSLVPSGGTVGSRTFEPVTRAVHRYLRKQSADFVALYRREHDLTARSLYEHALADRDPEKLAGISERYPLASIAGRAALAAADLYFEQGEPLSAWRVLDAWPWAHVPADVREPWATRMALIAAGRGNAANRRTWERRAGIDAAKAPKKKTSRRLDPGKRFDRLVDGANIELAWSSELVLQRSQVAADLLNGVMFSAVPTVSRRWVVFPWTRALDRFHLDDGRLLSRDTLPHWTRYTETRTAWRQEVATDGEILVAGYVAWANPKVGRGYRGGVQKVSVPRRELRALEVHDGGRVEPLWDTDGHDDELIEQLSFNSAPVVAGGTVFALGWRERGYVDAYLVALDLRTGAVRWKTLLVSNQVDLTRFGFLAMEPLLGELYLEDEVIYACTNLGACAAVTFDEGRIRWITEYSPVRTLLDIGQRRRMSYPYEPQTFWDRCTTVSLDDRIIVAPHDSPAAFAFHKKSGRMLQRRRIRGSHNYLLGARDGRVIFANRYNIALVPEHDISDPGTILSTEGSMRARPALTAEGIVYSTSEGLYYTTIGVGEKPETRILADFSIPRTGVEGRHSLSPDGHVTVVGDRVLVTSSRQIDCYRFALMERK